MYMNDLCIFLTKASSAVKKVCSDKSLLFDLFRGSANVALVHFGGESQRVQGLAEALLLGTDVDEHQGLRVAPKAVLQQVGQLRVAVGHVGGLLRKCHDNLAKIRKTLVDCLGFGEPHALASTLLDPLAPSEVNQVQNSTTGLQGGGVVSLNLQNKYTVTPGASLVAQGLCLALALPALRIMFSTCVSFNTSS